MAAKSMIFFTRNGTERYRTGAGCAMSLLGGTYSQVDVEDIKPYRVEFLLEGQSPLADQIQLHSNVFPGTVAFERRR